MDKPGQNPLARFDRQKSDYPLLGVAAALFVVLALGLILSVKDKYTSSAVLFFIATGIFVALVLIDIAIKRRNEAINDRKFIHWNAEMPELQRQNANIEVRELARLLKVDEDQHAELLSAYVVAGDLALRQVQQEENLPLMRHVSIGKTPFDGVLVDQELITCIEVAFLVVPDVRQDRVDSVLKKVAQAKKNLGEMKSRLRVRLMFVLVTQLSDEEEEDLRNTLGTRRFKDMPIDNVEIRFFDFEMLQKQYLSE